MTKLLSLKTKSKEEEVEMTKLLSLKTKLLSCP